VIKGMDIPQGSPLDICNVFEMLKKGKRCFCHNMENAHSGLKSGMCHLKIRSTGVNTFKYSMKRFRKATKCSAFLMLPGIASFSRSSGRTSDGEFLK
jgi:hypothetical protein